jgi:hypothetical protein
VDFQVLSRFEDLGTRAEEAHLHLYTAVVWHKTLQRRLRMVVLLHRKDPAKPRVIVLGSTDPELNGHKRIALYASRFQIEFLCRDSKQFTGLLDGQARAESALDCHFNASLATLNLVRAEDLCLRQGQEPPVFSMASWKPCQFNERLLDLLMEQLARDPTWVKNQSCDDELKTYGAIAAGFLSGPLHTAYLAFAFLRIVTWVLSPAWRFCSIRPSTCNVIVLWFGSTSLTVAVVMPAPVEAVQ